ncbi:Lantibiotic dehydratase, C terminus [Algoriphagus faecimaris]|uniref:Lantibiotic dehydratase, C terminus n=1 Tax=Algoriphagus faecimaris TaxID=686796 RepID=A0A1G6U8U8_9BACT|nr:lantibiotic dehydratase [Algoriphagus faecimaris]SDD37711.1 Lantibiotic dehydratase, C terminus [Algoriphagus faecimaris]
MKYLFRIPLFDFDPESEFSIQENWKKIKAAISLSSSSLYQKIKECSYAELDRNLRLKVLKYILRGRYRPTPFGKFAAVGIGNGESNQWTINLEKVKILLGDGNEEKRKLKSKWRLALAGNEKLDRYYFLSYIQEDERWGLVSIPKNKVIFNLIQHAQRDKKISYDVFASWFDRKDEKVSFEIWVKLLELGIVYQDEVENRSRNDTLKSENQSLYQDSILEGTLSLPHNISEDLSEFYSNGGDLFRSVNSPYLDSLKIWFQIKFDDRFVPLPLLLSYPEFINSDFLNLKFPEENPDQSMNFSADFWGSRVVDLKRLVPKKSLPEELFNIDFLFRIGKNKEMVVENVVTNRPFVYFGRFNRFGKILEYQEKIRDEIYHHEECIFAELRIVETFSISSICNTKPLFKWYISPFEEQKSGSISLKDIELGIRNGRFLLIHRKFGKQIIPVVLHPLNGKEISHPLIRLIWELDHQTSFKMIHYHSPLFTESNYVPQLNWGQITLQSQRWLIFGDDYGSEQELKNWLKTHQVPKRIQVGIFDRELVINWQNKDEFGIMWSEVKRYPRTVIREVPWFEKSCYYSTMGKMIYPQFVVSHRNKIPIVDWKGFLNSIDQEDKRCLYYLIRISEDELFDFLVFFFNTSFLGFLGEKKLKWYYLIYQEGSLLQVRIRFLGLTEKMKISLGERLSSSQKQFNFEPRPYYPEEKKYGRNTYKISEKIFWLESRFILESQLGFKVAHEWKTVPAFNLAEFWFEILTKASLGQLIFPRLKSRLRQVPHQTKRKIMGLIKKEKEFDKPMYLPESWKGVYLHLIQKHLDLQKDDSEKWRILQNHFHMQINRFYLMDRKFYEEASYYVLYRLLGQKIHGNKQDAG